MLLSFPVLTLFSGQGGDDSAEKKGSVIMERIGDCSSEDKNSSFVFCLAVLMLPQFTSMDLTAFYPL